MKPWSSKPIKKWGFGFRVWRLGFRVWGLGAGFRARELGFRAGGSGWFRANKCEYYLHWTLTP